jgi:hypothetical protein
MKQEKSGGGADDPLLLQGRGDVPGTPAGTEQDELGFSRADWQKRCPGEPRSNCDRSQQDEYEESTHGSLRSSAIAEV